MDPPYAGQFSQIEFAWDGRIRAESTGVSVRHGGRTTASTTAALLEFLAAPARARLIAPDLWLGDSGCGDGGTSFRLLTKFGRLTFASLLFADMGQPFEYIEAIPDLFVRQPFSQNLFGSWPVL